MTRLADREREVLLGIWEADGDIEVVVRRLGITMSTARTHTLNARRKLGVQTTLAAIRHVLTAEAEGPTLGVRDGNPLSVD
jgi:DNA-binding NarL/FixJ family response regulator